jgi:8-oxo-dGTP diphosphatase
MEQAIKKQFVAVRAVIIKDDKVLIIRESDVYGKGLGRYDFPGGKVQMGESINEAIEREVKEEVGIKVKIGNPFYVDEWRPVVKGEQVQIIGIFYICESMDSEVKLGSDHDDYKWMPVSDYSSVPLMKENANALEVLLKMKQ